ncbi:helix-turn-helix domain-containing protein [Pseudonocardia xinjiangensis]|uniref:Helix-turn-helix domain-containing protein n=1 Tax=Pseudonocardia xinjiangensis TaxID=75289 RepID=A0ABX1RH98_9PSEU|nr:helix-turn-helix domain-containing protein [Pseudonocardia xinjiangensis]NMH79768.1 helix-turn-helix domain-containing protein [Pseudonocardia xinjiangensis]
MTSGPGDKLLTTGELAKLLGVSPGAILKWTRSGLIIPTWSTPGGHHRWRLGDVQEQLRAARKRDD